LPIGASPDANIVIGANAASTTTADRFLSRGQFKNCKFGSSLMTKQKLYYFSNNFNKYLTIEMKKLNNIIA
jgi:hypothetical protein